MGNQKFVFGLYREFYDEYQCLEDSGYEVLGIFKDREVAEYYKNDLEKLDKKKIWKYGIQEFNFCSINKEAYDF